jgi:hypothetical protein
MKRVKLKSTSLINARRSQQGELWQARFYDYALRTVGDYHDCVDYIHRNPVQRGLVEMPEQWNWSSVKAASGMTAGVLEIDPINLPLDRTFRL